MTTELFERVSYLQRLSEHYHHAKLSNGHAVFLLGESGIGKTSLVNQFIKEIQNEAYIYLGACDSLFTPSPLGPLFDIARQVGQHFVDFLQNEKDRSLIFNTLFRELLSADKPVVLVFEDIHWADEATIDLIKFLCRRINQLKCLLLLTSRDNDIYSSHPMATIFGELPSNNFSKLFLTGLSRNIVSVLATQRGYDSGERLYDLTGGNPFYVTEILASYSPGIPERVKDSILAVFHARREDTQRLWEFLSVLPTSRIELTLAKRIEEEFAHCIDSCIAAGVIVSKPGQLSFKHELYRITIEESLLPGKRKTLHRKMLNMLNESPANSIKLSQFIHHAKYADEKELVAQLAPKAAREAAEMGSHMEASKLYSTAIEYTDSNDESLAKLYEYHAYECYLTNQVCLAIVSQQRALDIWKAKKQNLKIGNALRFLSRLLWFQEDKQKAVAYGQHSVSILENEIPTRELALAYTNLSQLYMNYDDLDKTLHWGHKAIALAEQMEDKEVLSHALNNIGTILLKYSSTESSGDLNLKRSLSLALENGFQEHAARAYTNLASSFVKKRNYNKAIHFFNEGLKYCEERGLSSWTNELLGWKAQVLFETGKWIEAAKIAADLQKSLQQHIIVKITTISTLARLEVRRGNFSNAKQLIHEAKILAIPTHIEQRMIPVLVAELELSWIKGDIVSITEIKEAVNTFFQKDVINHNVNQEYSSELAFWMYKCGLFTEGKFKIKLEEPSKLEIEGRWDEAAGMWKEFGCPYEYALSLFEGDRENQKQALRILNELGASATCEKLKSQLKLMGAKSIPRGLRQSTRNNPAQLTNRQIDVLVLMKAGFQNAEIADKLFISSKTVEHHISAILSKLGMNTRSKAVNEARILGILE
jgi:DNA-binding CsgD family transcriptional regulator/tetratricopeptide (TPR) repeat protein/GTPase SAR1 family protein